MTGWREHALCRGCDPALFFPERGNSQGVEQAKAVCGDCPVKAECLTDALANKETAGIRGGLSSLERRSFVHEAQPSDRTRVCICCGVEFLGAVTSRVCSEECRRQRKVEAYRRHNARRSTTRGQS